MAGANTQQYGIKNWRIYREPIDGETVQLTYQDILDRLEPNDAGDGTKLGTFYGGLITSVTSDENPGYNGPWYISYNIHDDKVAYSAERILTNSEINFEIGYLLENPKYTKPQMTVQFLIPNSYNEPTGEYELTPVTENNVVWQDIEVGSYFTPAFQVNWSRRTLNNTNGTRSAYSPLEVQNLGYSIPNELLGYSYGITDKGIKFGFCANPIFGLNNGGIIPPYESKESNELNSLIFGSQIYANTEGSLNTSLFEGIRIAYKCPSYMYYPQFYNRGRYEISYGEGETQWFSYGTYIPTANRYYLNSKYKYYYGFTEEQELTETELCDNIGLNEGFLNFSNSSDGTVVSFTVGDNYNCKYLWIAYPYLDGSNTSKTNIFKLGSVDDNIQIKVENPDGTCFDLVSDLSIDRNLQINNDGTYYRNRQDGATIVYSMVKLILEYPIGNKNSVISFKIVPNSSGSGGGTLEPITPGGGTDEPILPIIPGGDKPITPVEPGTDEPILPIIPGGDIPIEPTLPEA